MPIGSKHRFSVEEYQRMGETGVLKPQSRFELVDGEIIDMSPIGPFHGGVTKRLNRYFNRHAQGRYLVAVQDPVHLNQQSAPQPDLMLLKRAPDDYVSRHPAPEDVLLLVEVADASLIYDREQKIPAYGGAGIIEVWIVNLLERAIEIYREPHFAGYAAVTVLRSGDTARPLSFPDLGVDRSALLK